MSDRFWDGFFVGSILDGTFWWPSGGRDWEADAENRRKNIEDNYGIKAQSYKSFRDSHGGYGFWKTLGSGLAIGVVASGMALLIGTIIGATSLLLPVITIGLMAGSLGGTIVADSHNRKIGKQYSTYLDGVATEGREKRDHGRGAAEYDNGTPGKSYTADIT